MGGGINVKAKLNCEAWVCDVPARYKGVAFVVHVLLGYIVNAPILLRQGEDQQRTMSQHRQLEHRLQLEGLDKRVVDYHVATEHDVLSRDGVTPAMGLSQIILVVVPANVTILREEVIRTDVVGAELFSQSRLPCSWDAAHYTEYRPDRVISHSCQDAHRGVAVLLDCRQVDHDQWAMIGRLNISL